MPQKLLPIALFLLPLTLVVWSFSHPAGAITGPKPQGDGYVIQAENIPSLQVQALFSAMRTPREIARRYPFIQLEDNRLIFPDSSSNWTSIHSRMDSILSGNGGSLNILHMGGSHVQAGIVGHRIRELLHELAPGSIVDRGLLFPFRVASTNSTVFTGSDSYGEWDKFRCAHNRNFADWGMSGMLLQTEDDSSSLSMWAMREDSGLFRGREVRLYWNFEASNAQVFWSGQGRADSITFDPVGGCQRWFFEEAVDTLRFSFVQNDSTLAPVEVRGMWLGGQSGGIVYNEIGVNGASTRSYLRCEDFHKEVNHLRPDLVIFGIGVNDAHVRSRDFSREAFEARYDSLIVPMLASNPGLKILFLTNNDNHYRGRINPNGREVQKSMYALAEKYKGAVWDLYAVMGGWGSIDDWNASGLAKRDRVHFTRSGYELQAELMYLAWMEDFGQWLRNKHSHLSQSTDQP